MLCRLLIQPQFYLPMKHNSNGKSWWTYELRMKNLPIKKTWILFVDKNKKNAKCYFICSLGEFKIWSSQIIISSCSAFHSVECGPIYSHSTMMCVPQLLLFYVGPDHTDRNRTTSDSGNRSHYVFWFAST